MSSKKDKLCKFCGENFVRASIPLGKVRNEWLFFKLGYCYECASQYKEDSFTDSEYINSFLQNPIMRKALKNPKKRRKIIKQLKRKGLSEQEIEDGLKKFEDAAK